MKRPYVDSHAHLDFPDFEADLEAVLERARLAGIAAVLTVGTSLATSRRALEIARGHDGVRASVGVHPHDAAEVDASALETLAGLAAEGAAAVGEIGLDFYRDRSPRDAQRTAFRAQLRLATRLDLPVIVHSRNAWAETAAILREEPPPRGGVVHCFSGDREEAREALALGFHLSFAGPLTYPNAKTARAAASSVPLDRLLIETDAPFLAPQAFRGRRNEPAHVVEVARAQAALHDAAVEDAGWITGLAARTLFGLGLPIPASKIAYALGDGLYINATNRCTDRCVFCARLDAPVVGGHDLDLPAEPTVAEIREAVRAAGPARFREVVFCGYGEPTLRLDAVLEIGRWLKSLGHRVRLNTNGSANLVHGRDVTPELATAVDVLSVSLNAQDAGTYERLCRPDFGPRTHTALLDFVKAARGRIGSITLTALDGLEGVDLDACRALAEGLGVGFRERPYRSRD